MSQRRAAVERSTRETQIKVRLDLDGSGSCECRLDLGFLRHMLELMAYHGRFDLVVEAAGDLETDDHHLTEDLGILLGQAIIQALGDKKGIRRYGHALLPMDEVLVAAAVDLSGRAVFTTNYRPQREKVGDLSTELVSHFFRSLAGSVQATVHLHMLEPGENEHHRIEALFKGFGRALRMAVGLDSRAEGEIPSTKGEL